MKKIQKAFKQKGFAFQLLKRLENVALLEKTSKGGGVSYEVVVIRAHNGYSIAGTEVAASEFLPKDEDFGKFGWSYSTLEAAEKKFHEVKKEKWEYLIVDESKPKGGKRGRKPVNFQVKYPDGEFSMKDLAEHNNKTPAYMYTFLKQRGLFSEIVEVREEKAGRGKPRKIYKKR